MVLNLLTNAVRFTAPDGRITIAYEARAAYVAITVRDTGVGIPADKLGDISELFVPVAPSRTRQHDGTGLDLVISRDPVRGMGGDLVVESTPGEGSTFTLTLNAVRHLAAVG